MSTLQVAIIDYNLGNVKSMCNAISEIGANYILTKDPQVILAADGLILPGVGAFKHGMQQLEELGLIEVIQAYIQTSKPFLGVCLGMQMLFDESDEYGFCKGLGLIEGKVEKLNIPTKGKLTHVGWNSIINLNSHENDWEGTILQGMEPKTDVYFVHSYAAKPSNDEYILSVTSYNDSVFCSSVKKGNIYGCQFHPEKSAQSGLAILNNFIALTKIKKDK